MLGGDESS